MEYWKFIRSTVGKARVIIPGVDVALIRNNKILLVKSNENSEWFLPGGLQELGECVFETGAREVQEELGLQVTCTELVSVYSGAKWIRSYQNGDELQSLTFLVLAAFDDTQTIVPDPQEISDYGWFGFSDLPKGMHDYSEMMIKDLTNYKGSTLMR